jgi:hypothetical protein
MREEVSEQSGSMITSMITWSWTRPPVTEGASDAREPPAIQHHHAECVTLDYAVDENFLDDNRNNVV